MCRTKWCTNTYYGIRTTHLEARLGCDRWHGTTRIEDDHCPGDAEDRRAKSRQDDGTILREMWNTRWGWNCQTLSLLTKVILATGHLLISWYNSPSKMTQDLRGTQRVQKGGWLFRNVWESRFAPGVRLGGSPLRWMSRSSSDASLSRGVWRNSPQITLSCTVWSRLSSVVKSTYLVIKPVFVWKRVRT